MQKITKELLRNNPQWVEGSVSELFELPEKVLQFGTGVLLRALPDFIIDKANKAGVFNGRIVVVKSTDQGGTDTFSEQDNLYTVCVRGIKAGEEVKENVINTAVSRVLAASTQWQEILTLAKSNDLEVVISNTTEVGIVLEKEIVTENVPKSFPGKLLAILHQRFLHFNGDSEKGLVIVPTELVSDNGDKLKSILTELAYFNSFSEEFVAWLLNSNFFCNSLVDRIVPGSPKGDIAEEIKGELPYQDDLLIMSEPYALWAISGDEKVKEKLSFVNINAGAFVEQDITKYKELKLRLLNGTHTLTCGLAFFAGFKTVKEAMADQAFYSFLSRLMTEEIAPSIPYALDSAETDRFAFDVLDRFKNPFIEHFWINITLNFTQKIELRIVSLLEQYYRTYQKAPKIMATGLAAYIRFMKPESFADGKVYGSFGGNAYLIQDQLASSFDSFYKTSSTTEELVSGILADTRYWKTDLTQISGLVDLVTADLDTLTTKGAKYLIQNTK